MHEERSAVIVGKVQCIEEVLPLQKKTVNSNKNIHKNNECGCRDQRQKKRNKAGMR